MFRTGVFQRNRYWGTPLNIWKCDDCGELESIGSIEELKEKGDNFPDDIELHKPYIDKITIKCPHCGKQCTEAPEVIDCWFDSGSMPFAQHHYPFENKELFEQQFPAHSSYLKLLTRQEDGSIHFLQSQHYSSIRLLMKMLSFSVTFSIRMAIR